MLQPLLLLLRPLANIMGGKVDTHSHKPGNNFDQRLIRAERRYTQSLWSGLCGLHYIGWPSWQCFLEGLPSKICDLMLRAVTGEFFFPLLIKRWDSSLALSLLLVHCYTAGCMVQNGFQLWSTSVCQPVQTGLLDPHRSSYYYNGAPCAV